MYQRIGRITVWITGCRTANDHVAIAKKLLEQPKQCHKGNTWNRFNRLYDDKYE